MPHFDVSLDHLLLALIALIVWAVRLEAKVLSSKKDINGIGRRIAETNKEIKYIQLDLMELGTRYKSEHHNCKCGVSDDKKI